MNISSIITNKFIKEEKTRAPLYTWRLHARPTLQQNYKTLFIIKNVTEDEENYKTLKKERKKKNSTQSRRENRFKIAGPQDENSCRSWDPQVHVSRLHGHVSIKYEETHEVSFFSPKFST